MKKNLSLLVGIFSFFTGVAQTEEIINIPDPNFKNALLNHNPAVDTNNDGEIQLSEAQTVVSLQLFFANISDLTGIEHFVNLQELDCGQNQLTSLDVSQNTALKELRCNQNQLTNLNISQNTVLEHLSCYRNQLTSLDVSQNTALKELLCFVNQITSLDISQNTALESLYFAQNQVTNLDVSQNANLKFLSCSYNQLTNLDVSQNADLQILYCASNQLSSIDVSQNTNLGYFTCNGNTPLSSLNLANGNNENITLMAAYSCPNLSCIQIDEGFTPPPYQEDLDTGWDKDNSASYSTDCNIASVEEVYTLKATIYPNPTTDVLYLEAEQPITATTVYDLSGKEVFSTKETNSVDVSELPAGVYFIEIKTNEAKTVKKFVKE